MLLQPVFPLRRREVTQDSTMRDVSEWFFLPAGPEQFVLQMVPRLRRFGFEKLNRLSPNLPLDNHSANQYIFALSQI
jgi:hypothetical protein